MLEPDRAYNTDQEGNKHDRCDKEKTAVYFVHICLFDDASYSGRLTTIQSTASNLRGLDPIDAADDNTRMFAKLPCAFLRKSRIAAVRPRLNTMACAEDAPGMDRAGTEI